MSSSTTATESGVETARQRVADRIDEIQSRLSPKAIARELASSLGQSAGTVATAIQQSVFSDPVSASALALSFMRSLLQQADGPRPHRTAKSLRADRVLDKLAMPALEYRLAGNDRHAVINRNPVLAMMMLGAVGAGLAAIIPLTKVERH